MTILSSSNKKINGLWMVLLLAAPIILWVLPAGFFDDKQTICPSKLFFDVECLGCGITRAVMHFHHFDFDDAIYFNRGVFVVYPALVILWFVWVFKAFKKAGVITAKA
jgi:Protein of unknown function (DUF2752)